MATRTPEKYTVNKSEESQNQKERKLKLRKQRA